jgi:hypothetical protein
MEKATMGLLLAEDLETTTDEDAGDWGVCNLGLYAIPHGRPLWMQNLQGWVVLIFRPQGLKFGP